MKKLHLWYILFDAAIKNSGIFSMICLILWYLVFLEHSLKALPRRSLYRKFNDLTIVIEHTFESLSLYVLQDVLFFCNCYLPSQRVELLWDWKKFKYWKMISILGKTNRKNNDNRNKIYLFLGTVGNLIFILCFLNNLLKSIT